MMSGRFTGLWVALATPFQRDGEVDLLAFRRLVRYVIDGGVDGLVVLGSTGEAATLVDHERDELITVCLQEAGDVPVVVGTGHNATRQAAAWTKRAQQFGAHGALVVTPYYNKPMPNGLVAHYEAIAEAAPGLPIIVYNVPGRTGLNITPSTLARLWGNPSIAAVKESSGNLAQIGEVARTVPAGRTVLSGDDNLAVASIAIGAQGLVSVLANIAPSQTKAMVAAALSGDAAEAKRWHKLLLPLMDALFVESNPIPLKAAMQILGVSESYVRLPLTEAEPSTYDRLEEVLKPVLEIANAS